ncbi:MAG: hypothetical protein B6I35_03265 [Anaerolineaceae bacterium 4572_32.2]|nr:MAG: hypothetical protein B6I35_03265 [Anaerolineaceae bacterium 4572_32.2]
MERWNNTLRQRLARFVRKTPSFSKSGVYHKAVLKLYLHLQHSVASYISQHITTAISICSKAMFVNRPIAMHNSNSRYG